jgi:hypothetical protein
MLAADAVTAVVTGTNLTITGDGGDDTFLVSGDGTTDGAVTITGFTSSGGNATLINGAASVSLTGVTGNVTINLGTGTTGGATVSVADLDVGRNLSITGNASDGNTIDVGTVAAVTTPSPVLSTNAVTVGDNLSIRTGNGDLDSVTIGATPLTGTDVTVSGDLSISAGSGDDTITELSLAVTRDETISAGAGDDTIAIGGPTVAAAGVTIGRGLSISVGGGDDTITEASTSVARSESISLGPGDDSVTLGTPTLSVTASVLPAVHAAAIAQVVADGDVAIGRDLDVQMGSGDSSLSATGVQIGDTLLITGGGGFGFGGYGGGYGGGFDGGFFGRLANTADDTITLDDVTSHGAGIFTGFSTTDTVNIQGSTFSDLGVGLGSGSGSLSIGTTTTSHSTILVGLGTANTYSDLGGNSFTNLHTYGLTPAPTATVVAATTPVKEVPTVKALGGRR